MNDRSAKLGEPPGWAAETNNGSWWRIVQGTEGQTFVFDVLTAPTNPEALRIMELHQRGIGTPELVQWSKSNLRAETVTVRLTQPPIAGNILVAGIAEPNH